MGTGAHSMEISATSPLSFDDALRAGLARASRMAKVQGAWVKAQQVDITNGHQSFRVMLHVAFDS